MASEDWGIKGQNFSPNHVSWKLSRDDTELEACLDALVAAIRPTSLKF